MKEYSVGYRIVMIVAIATLTILFLMQLDLYLKNKNKSPIKPAVEVKCETNR
jgi:hypothetical protein